MTTGTIRDQIWTMAMARAAVGEQVLPSEVVERVGCSDRTARDTLNAAARTPYLRRDARPDGTVRYLPLDPSSEE